jgi:hypothetical protein
MDFIGSILKGLVAIGFLMTVGYLIGMNGGGIPRDALVLFMAPIYVAMLLANPPARKGLAAAGLAGMAVILIAGSSVIVWPLLLTIPPTIGYIVGTRSFREWDSREVN